MTSRPETSNELNPEKLLQMGMSFTSSRVLAAGVQLHVFSHIAAGQRTPSAIARAAGASERGMGMLLDALTALELLTKSGGTYQLTPAAARYLVRDSPDYFGAMLENDSLWEAWGKLTEAVRTGQPPRRLEQQAQAEEFFPVLIRSLHVLNREPARRAAQALGMGTTRRGVQALDVACGSGVWGIAIAEADPTARLTLQDFPGVLDHTRQYLRKHGILDRCDFLPGDLKQVSFGEARYDLALLGNIVHSEGERSSRDLFRRLHRALKSGGQLAIVDMIPNEERTGPPYPILFALTMLVNTETGGTYTLTEYTAWLTEAGFVRVETADIGSHSPLIIARKS